MKNVLTFGVLLLIKAFGFFFYRIEVSWVGNKKASISDIKLLLLLNHTSLFEPIYLSVLPISLLWKISQHGVLPGADITMSRPVMGWFFRLVTPSTVSISRRRDKTWNQFLERVTSDSIVIIAPEGRMKRTTGLDKKGNPMTVRGGVYDLLEKINSGNILFAYSGGLHHIMEPDEKLPRLFKRIKIAIDIVSVDKYKAELKAQAQDPRLLRIKIARDLESRRDKNCPTLSIQEKRNFLKQAS